jgi:biopolymer transport protein ExbB
MLAHILVKYFEAGGPVMWPILITAIVAVGVVGERTFWWLRESRRRDPETLGKIFAALEAGDFAGALRLSKDTEDAVIRMIWHGMSHHHASMHGAMQVAAQIELQKAGQFLAVMDTLVTLAPLLGLLGTVSGIFRTFLSIGSAAVEGGSSQIPGGIGEAMIPTMWGLAIAILSLIPLKYFSRRSAQLQFEFESAATNVEIMVQAARQKGFETVEFPRETTIRKG